MPATRSTLLAAGLLLAAAALAPAGAADNGQPAARQSKQAACDGAATAKGLKGAARDSFLKKCLSRPDDTAAVATKQEMCADQANQKKLAGAARTSFINKCVGG
jgi:hypothetical protein